MGRYFCWWIDRRAWRLHRFSVLAATCAAHLLLSGHVSSFITRSSISFLRLQANKHLTPGATSWINNSSMLLRNEQSSFNCIISMWLAVRRRQSINFSFWFIVIAISDRTGQRKDQSIARIKTLATPISQFYFAFLNVHPTNNFLSNGNLTRLIGCYWRSCCSWRCCSSRLMILVVSVVLWNKKKKKSCDRQVGV